MISLLAILLSISPIQQEYKEQQAIYAEQMKPEGEKLFDFIYSKKIRWYCKWCMWQRDLYDCSSFISLYLIEKGILKRRLNSYIFAHYGVRINKNELKKGDIVIILQWSGNHTMYFNRFENGEIIITDAYINKTTFSDRRIPYMWEWQQVFYIGNPAVYWLNKSFLTHYRRLAWPNFFTH